jgi:tRNA(adenine34) deaminase
MDDDALMDLALAEARRCLDWDDVPVGAVLVLDEEVLAACGNQRERLEDPTAHAEILALRGAARRLGRWRLDGSTIYVTKEPCPMCAGALVQARVARLVYGAADAKGGYAGSLANVVQDERLNHQVEVITGVREAEAAALLKEFFARRRSEAGSSGPQPA